MMKKTTLVKKLPKGDSLADNEDTEFFKEKLEKARAKESNALTGYSRVGRNNV